MLNQYCTKYENSFTSQAIQKSVTSQTKELIAVGSVGFRSVVRAFDRCSHQSSILSQKCCTTGLFLQHSVQTRLSSASFPHRKQWVQMNSIWQDSGLLAADPTGRGWACVTSVYVISVVIMTSKIMTVTPEAVVGTDLPRHKPYICQVQKNSLS